MLTYRDLKLACLMSLSDNEIVAFVASSVLILFVSGLRFRHFQRSTFDRFIDVGAVFTCHQGKSRVRGTAAPPFRWALPFNAFTPDELVQKFVSTVSQVAKNNGRMSS